MISTITVNEDNLPALYWKTIRIKKPFNNTNNIIRVEHIKTARTFCINVAGISIF